MDRSWGAVLAGDSIIKAGVCGNRGDWGNDSAFLRHEYSFFVAKLVAKMSQSLALAQKQQSTVIDKFKQAKRDTRTCVLTSI